MDMSKHALVAWAFERHGIGSVRGYNHNGVCCVWSLRCHRDCFKLPDDQLFEWVN